MKGNDRTDADEELYGEDYRPTLTKTELKFFERQRKREMDRILQKVIFIYLLKEFFSFFLGALRKNANNFQKNEINKKNWK